MTEADLLADQFEANRAHLRAVAYRMLGSVTEADDAVQEAWLRLSRADAAAIDNLGGWLTTVVGRVCLDLLRARRTRREQPLGDRMPEPIVDAEAGVDPEHEALLADSVGLALLVVLETLSPAERLAFVLHDMFARAVRRDRADRRALAGRGAAAREPRAPPRARHAVDARHRPRAPARGRPRVPRRRARRRLRGARRAARPRRRAARRPRRPDAHGGRRGAQRRRPRARLRPARAVRPAGAGQRRRGFVVAVRGRPLAVSGSPSSAAGSRGSTCWPIGPGSAGWTSASRARARGRRPSPGSATRGRGSARPPPASSPR